MNHLHILTAIRNESAILPEFLDEIRKILCESKLIEKTTLSIVDDYSLDHSKKIIEQWSNNHPDLNLQIIPLKANLGNQGALAYGLRQTNAKNDDFILTLDSDGEDDLTKIPEIIKLAEAEKDKVIFTERGQRYDRLVVRILFKVFRLFMKLLCDQEHIPNNYMLLPGRYADAMKRSPYCSVYYSLAALRLRFPYLTKRYDRRVRYGGNSSQNLYNLITHGFVGFLIFHEIVIARIFVYLILSTLFFFIASGFSLFVKFMTDKALPGWTALFLSVNFGFIVFIAAMLGVMASISMFFKLANYQLTHLEEN